MNKITFFACLLLFVGFTSCSSDDGNKPLPEEEYRIIGKWEVEGININGETQDLNVCSTQSTVEFFSNGIAQFIFYSGTGDCIVETSEEKWGYLGNNLYEFFEVEDGKKYGATIKFSNHSHNMTIIEENTDGVIIIDYRRI